MSDSHIETVVLPDVALHLDARWFPVLVVTWFGIPTTGAVARYSLWLDRMGLRAEAEGTRLVIVGDTTRLEERPGPEVRTAMVAAIEGLAERHAGRFLGGATIIGQPVMRAVLTMVLVLSRRTLDMKPVKDMGSALARAFELLDHARIPRPPGLDAATFRSPARPR